MAYVFLLVPLIVLLLVWYLLSNRPRKVTKPLIPEEFDTGRGRRLLVLLKGNVPSAKRMIEETRSKHPGKDREWCIGQAIAEIERDRK
ncbi:hypothetical protein V2H45_11940 [Tumidithrix elongata RA019]|uniref:Uncharacterized protein n=1 Tax=Tumidithrix elongata BACA0141 TaxID=2716417 RepID=A0AAW9Q0T7_9CYAN|nr:hypothetical protein [Tumidithrix elongata RA019]